MSGGDKEWCRRAKSFGYSTIYDPSVVVEHPTLSRWRDLIRKHRRIAGGWAIQDKLGITPRSNSRYRGFRKRSLNLGLMCLTSIEATKVFLTHYFIRAIFHVEKLRCRLGGTPERL